MYSNGSSEKNLLNLHLFFARANFSLFNDLFKTSLNVLAVLYSVTKGSLQHCGILL